MLDSVSEIIRIKEFTYFIYAARLSLIVIHIAKE